jgi:hypothetical protein
MGVTQGTAHTWEVHVRHCKVCTNSTGGTMWCCTNPGRALHGRFIYYWMQNAILIGLARILNIRCIYDIFGRELTKYTVIYGAYTRFWPTLHIDHMSRPFCSCSHNYRYHESPVTCLHTSYCIGSIEHKTHTQSHVYTVAEHNTHGHV